LLRLVRSQVMFKLGANLTLYVRPDGNDLNNGASNDPAHAFMTIQAAINYVAQSFAIAGRTVTIELGIPGTYQPYNNTVQSIIINSIPGSLIIRGDPSNRLGYLVLGPTAARSGVGQVCIISGSGMNVQLIGFTLQARVSNSNMLEVDYQAYCAIQDMCFTGVALSGANHIAGWGGQVTISNYIDVYNSAACFCGGYTFQVTAGLWFTLITVHGCAFNTFLSLVDSYMTFSAGWCSFAGGGSGYRYLLYYNSVLITYGGPNYLPGNMAGGCDASSVVA
jgi:hypothetical protein